MSYYHWLGASAEPTGLGSAEAPEPPPRLGPTGAIPCAHIWRAVWNDYHSSCRECEVCGASEVREYR